MGFKKAIACLLMLCLFAVNTVVFTGAIETSAKACILIEASTGRVLYEKNSNQRLGMASTTKIMTALLTLEQSGLALDAPFVVNPEAIMVEGSSMGLQEGDLVTLRTLASGMLLPSGNDAANAAAVRLCGTQKEFVELMNQRAADIGMKDTHFETPSGLDGENHYSTASDMAKLARVALKNQAFLDICSKSTMKLQYGNPSYTRYLSNHNRLLKEYDGAIGVKTGFTKKSGRCLVSAAQRNGVTLIAVTLNASNDWDDHKKMLDFGFSNVQLMELKSDLNKVEIEVVGGLTDKVEVEEVFKPTAPILAEDVNKITTKLCLDRFYYAPIKRGNIVGKCRYMLGDEVVAMTTLVAKDDVEVLEQKPKFNFFSWFR